MTLQFSYLQGFGILPLWAGMPPLPAFPAITQPNPEIWLLSSKSQLRATSTREPPVKLWSLQWVLIALLATLSFLFFIRPYVSHLLILVFLPFRPKFLMSVWMKNIVCLTCKQRILQPSNQHNAVPQRVSPEGLRMETKDAHRQTLRDCSHPQLQGTWR